VKSRPILFSAPMVRAILDGRKTMTRRAWKMPRGCDWYAEMGGEQAGWFVDHGQPWWLHVTESRCPYGVPDDQLWVRETWQTFFEDEVPADRPKGPRHTMGIPARPDRKSYVYYRADGELHSSELGAAQWSSPIHLARRYSRITLEITGVRVERLCDISEADAMAEGARGGHGAIPGYGYAATPVEHFRHIWESINGPGSWDANPWTWAIEFRRVT